jgi:hypothetical protein
MSSFACVDSLHYDAAQKTYIGKSASTGQTRVFAGLPQYQQFLSNMEKSGHVCPDVSIPQVHVPRPACGLTKEDPSTGFLEFKPKNAAMQSLYDAMSPIWRGTSETNDAVKKGLFKADAVYASKTSDLTSAPRQQASGRGVPREAGSSR